MQFVLTHLRSFAHEHDDIVAFHATYLVLTFLAAALFNLGVFALLIITHMCLDIVKYRDVHGYGWKLTIKGIAHESLIDVTLLMVALVFSVYFHHSVAFVGVSGFLRAETTLVRFFGMLIPKIKIIEHTLKVLAHLHLYLEHVHPSLHSGWRRMDYFYMACIGFCLFLLTFAHQILQVEPSVIQWIVLWELTPWNV